jgi:hypothetical protein
MAYMDPSIAIPAEEMAAVVQALGDSDSTMRKNAALLIARLTNPATLDAAQAELFRLLKVRTNGNGVYNGVVVLGSWLKRNDPAVAAREDAILTELSELRATLSSESGWANTIALIDEYTAA